MINAAKKVAQPQCDYRSASALFSLTRPASYFLYICRLKKQLPNPEVSLMEKRIGTITILVLDRSVAPMVNSVISDNAEIVLARQGLPFQHRNVAVISLIVEGTVNEINTLSGKLGRIDFVEVKVAVTKLA